MENSASNTVGTSPCEAELQELMEQIDIMVSNKKLDWERKMRALETRLDLRDQELANAQTCLDQKGQEVGLLRQKLDSLEKCNLAMTQNYEGQLQSLRAQFSVLTSSFEKLRLHQMRQSRFRRREVPHLKEDVPFEPSNLNQKLEKQAQSFQTQINGKKQFPEGCSSEIPQLICEAEPSFDASEKDEFIIEKLKSAVSEIAFSRNKLQDENQRLLQELKMYQRQCQAMEAGLSEVKSELQSRDDLLRVVEMERLQLHRELLKFGECQNAQEAKRSPEKKKKELVSVLPDPQSREKESGTTRSRLYPEEEPERMRAEISALTEELQQKELTIAMVMKKAALLERQLKAELEIKEKMLAKQQVSDARRAARMESTHLKGMMGDLDTGRLLRMDFSGSHSGHPTLNKLESENERLRHDLAKLHASGNPAWTPHSTFEEAGHCAYPNHARMDKNESRLSPNRSATPPLSPLPFPCKDMSGEDGCFSLSPPDIAFPASLATQHFLLEEERRARELEKLLNTHIDELQRHTEFTLNKYTKLKQNRHI
ncbi:deuterosome assembly protein 1 [Sorex araneus]|uniref:deuterosome assembly protein 1 n=1 Tax=Sorex araneus TaxID=42254 RepID=UPI0024339BBE|nr:deuterosome assembly protein 1 [Sorex araneus]